MVTLIGLTRKAIAMNRYKAIKLIGILLTIVGITIALYIYTALIILGDILYNPLSHGYYSIVKSIPFVYYLNYGGLNVDILGDFILFIATTMAVVGTFLYYLSKTRNLRYSFGKTLFSYSVLIAFLIFFSIYILSGVSFIIFHTNANNNGFQYWTNSVTSSTCFFRMPNWSIATESCYFINYAELFIFSIIGAVIGYMLYIRED